MKTFLILLVLVHGVILMLFWTWAARRGRTSLRLLALCFGLLALSFGGVLWWLTRSAEILTGTVIGSVLISLGTLSWRFTSPKLLRKLNIKW
jgi:hypothetical protein